MKAKQYVPPWKQPYIIAVAGSSGSGKTSVAQLIIKQLNVPWTVLLSMDNFYRTLTPEESAAAHRNEHDFDTPTAYDTDDLVKCLRDIKAGQRVNIPTYSFVEHARTDKTVSIYGANIVILEGIYVLYDHPGLLDLIDMKIFVDTDLDTCLARRLTRDMLHRGREMSGILNQWRKTVKPNFERYVRPTMANADVLIPRGRDNVVAIDMVAQHITKILTDKSERHLADLCSLIDDDELAAEEATWNSQIHELKQSPQLIGIHTILCSDDTKRADFVFYFDRIATLLVENALQHSKFENITVETPAGNTFEGVRRLGIDNTCAVAIIRAGECFDRSVKRTIPAVRMGKLLIQSDISTGEPKLHHLNLPTRISEPDAFVLLCDAQLSSGAAAIMATTVLVDHGVKEENIVFVCYLASKRGLQRYLNAYPNVHTVVGKILDGSHGRFIDTKYYGT